MKLLIMTRGRVGKQITLSAIPEPWRSQTYLVIPAEEWGEHQDISRLNQIVVPPYVDNYSKKFQWILDGHAVKDNKVVIMDDDLSFSERVNVPVEDKDYPNATKVSLVKLDDPYKLNYMFDEISTHLETTALVGVHPRQMGQNAPLPFKRVGKVITIQGVNLALASPIPRVDMLPILADVFFNMAILSRGMENRLVTKFVQDHASCQAPGGCSLYRTPEMQRQAVEMVADMYPDFAKVVIKRPKQAKWMGDERHDLRVQWKKLYEWGVANR